VRDRRAEGSASACRHRGAQQLKGRGEVCSRGSIGGIGGRQRGCSCRGFGLGSEGMQEEIAGQYGGGKPEGGWVTACAAALHFVDVLEERTWTARKSNVRGSGREQEGEEEARSCRSPCTHGHMLVRGHDSAQYAGLSERRTCCSLSFPQIFQGLRYPFFIGVPCPSLPY